MIANDQNSNKYFSCLIYSNTSKYILYSNIFFPIPAYNFHYLAEKTICQVTINSDFSNSSNRKFLIRESVFLLIKSSINRSICVCFCLGMYWKIDRIKISYIIFCGFLLNGDVRLYKWGPSSIIVKIKFVRSLTFLRLL